MVSMPRRAAKVASQGAGRSRRGGRTDQQPSLPARKRSASTRDASTAAIDLAVAIIAVENDEPMVEVLPSYASTGLDRLPATRFVLGVADSLEEALRASVETETGHAVGFLQQLSAVVERDAGTHNTVIDRVLIGYLALVHDNRRGARLRRERRTRSLRASRWQGCYQHLPWEDWRQGNPSVVADVIIPRLAAWAKRIDPALSKAALARLQAERSARARIAFDGSTGWDEEKVLMRFQLLEEAGLIYEGAFHNGQAVTDAEEPEITLGRPMAPGHRRILAAGLGRLRMDMKSRPVIFELMDEEFSLFELQRTVEAILGPNLHKQNFRRLIETAQLVEPTGRMKSHTGGRPAKLYRFRRDVLLERRAR